MKFYFFILFSFIFSLSERYHTFYEIEEQLIEQIYFQVNRNDKFEALCRIVDMEDSFLWIVFCRTKNDVDDITIQLQNRGYDADWLHWDVKQSTREKILKKLKDRKINLLIATDDAARWIDINNLSHVINYSLPDGSENYTHRIWRTWRAWKTWVAITFVTASEHRRLFYIQKDNESEIKKEKLPSLDDVLSKKKNRLIENIVNTLDDWNISSMNEIASDLLNNKDPQNVVCGLLKYFCKSEFDPSTYKETSKPEREWFIDSKWITRLFFAKWKRDGMSPGKIIDIINDHISIDKNKIKDIGIYEEFSFLNMPFAEAEDLLSEIRKRARWALPLISKAKSKPRWAWWFDRGNSRWGPRWWRSDSRKWPRRSWWFWRWR